MLFIKFDNMESDNDYFEYLVVRVCYYVSLFISLLILKINKLYVKS